MFPYRVDNPRMGPAFATAALIAHASGFIAGALLVLLFRSRGRASRRESSLSQWAD